MKKCGFLLWMLLSPAWVSAVQGTLKPLKGTTYLQREGKNLWETVSKAVAVEEGDRIRTNNDSGAFLIFPDDHRLAIGADSYLTLSRLDQGETKIYLKVGSVRSKVRHLELGEYYKVQSPAAVAAVRGTDFSVTQLPREQTTQVRVFEGFVDVSALRADIAHEVIHLTVGQKTSVDVQGHVDAPRAMEGAGKTSAPSDGKPAARTPGDQISTKHSTGPPPPGGESGGIPSPSNGVGKGNSALSGSDGMGPKVPSTPALGEDTWFNNPEKINEHTFDDHAMVNRETTGSETESRVSPPHDPDSSVLPTAKNPPENGVSPSIDGKSETHGTPENSEKPDILGTPGTPGTPGNPITLGPPPSGNGPTPPGINPIAVGNQALLDTIHSQKLQDQLGGLLVASLYNDGSVKLSPVDHLFHLYADAVAQNGPDGIKFLNATMVSGHADTLNYQTTAIKFNQPLPSTDYMLAMRTAFQGDPVSNTPTSLPPIGPVKPTYYATEVENYRSNTVDYVDVQAGQGSLLLNGNRYSTDFAQGKTVANGVTLWEKNAGVYSYLGGAAPVVTTMEGGGLATSGVKNSYADGTYLGRQVTYIDGSGKIASLASIPAGAAARDFLGSKVTNSNEPNVSVQDVLNSNLFHKGPIVSFASAQSRLLGGIDSAVTNSDAEQILSGSMPVGAPDGLLRSQILPGQK